MNHIPLVNLKRQYLSIRKSVDATIHRVCESSDFILGPEVAIFESAFAEYLNVKYCIGVANGTDAIKLMAIAAGITRGDEVIVQANTFIATVLPFIELGATPIFVDCDPETGQLDMSEVKRAITKKTRAIVPVHLYGHPAPIQELLELRRIQKLSHILILEDAAQAHGSHIGNKKCGSFGDMASFSFYPGKNLGAYGDGGAVVTNNTMFAKKLRILRNIGQRKKYDHAILGTNSRLDTIQAAVLSVKLPYLDTWNKKREDIALRYQSGLKNIRDIHLPPKNSGTNWHVFTIRTKKRDALIAYLKERDIHTGIHYPVPLHLTPALSFLGYKKGDFPHSELRAKTLITLPIYAELTKKEVSYIIQTIQTFFIA